MDSQGTTFLNAQLGEQSLSKYDAKSWWPDAAFEACSDIASAMDDKRHAWARYLSHADGSQERSVAWDAWKAGCRRQRTAELAFDIAIDAVSAKLKRGQP